MKTEYIDIVVKREPKRNGGGLIFFFRQVEHCPDGSPTVEYYSPVERCHGTASLEYFRECKYIKYLTDEILEKVDSYRRYTNSLPDFKYYKIRLFKKLKY